MTDGRKKKKTAAQTGAPASRFSEALMELMETRRSVRAFTDDPVTDEEIRRLIHAAIQAPTGGNVQPWFFMAVRREKLQRGLIRAALGQSFVGRAPVTMVVCVDLRAARRSYGARGEHLYCIQDTAAAIQNMLLMAHSMGLSTCWVGAFDELEAARVLGLKEYLRPVALIPVGRPAMQPAPPGRRPVKDVLKIVK